MPWTWGWK